MGTHSHKHIPAERGRSITSNCSV